MESGIKENFAIGIWNPGFWDPEFNSRNLESHQRLESRIQVMTNSGLQYLECGIHGVEFKIQDCPRFPGRSIQSLSRLTPNSNKRKKGCDCTDQRKSFLDRKLCVETILKITDNFIFFSLSSSLSLTRVNLHYRWGLQPAWLRNIYSWYITQTFPFTIGTLILYIRSLSRYC